jgi:hypothetical protein
MFLLCFESFDKSYFSLVRGLEDYIRALSLNAKESDRDREVGWCIYTHALDFFEINFFQIVCSIIYVFIIRYFNIHRSTNMYIDNLE